MALLSDRDEKEVPRTVVNEGGSIAGALPEAEFVNAVIAAAQSR
jgi:hypothetical protein